MHVIRMNRNGTENKWSRFFQKLAVRLQNHALVSKICSQPFTYVTVWYQQVSSIIVLLANTKNIRIPNALFNITQSSLKRS